MKEFRIAHRGLSIGVHSFDFEPDSSFFDSFPITEGTKGNVLVHVEIIKSSLLIELRMVLSGEVKAVCDRCLEEFMLPISGKLDLFLKYGEQEEGNDDDFIVLSHDDDYIDLTTPIYDMFVLSYPLRIVHPEGECDKDMERMLNSFIVNSGERIDPRWDELKKLID